MSKRKMTLSEKKCILANEAYEKFQKKMDGMSARYLVEFGCKHAFIDGFDAGIKSTKKLAMLAARPKCEP